MTFKEYLSLFKFRYHLNFILVIFGALVFSNNISLVLFKDLFFLYVSLNFFLYSGIYTLNDIVDKEKDQKHPSKRKRVIASNKISVESATVFSFFLISTGLLFALIWFNVYVFFIFLTFLAINLFYTFYAKNIQYLELLVNSLTYPLRVFLGIFIVAKVYPIILLVAVFFFALGGACVRRIIEKNSNGNNARSTLKYYHNRILFLIILLCFIIMLICAFIDNKNFLIYLYFICFYLLFVFGIYFLMPILKFWKWVWMR